MDSAETHTDPVRAAPMHGPPKMIGGVNHDPLPPIRQDTTFEDDEPATSDSRAIAERSRPEKSDPYR